MRLKRSRDSRLVDNFQRTREEMQVESQQNHSSGEPPHHREEEEEDDDEDLQASLEISSVC